MGKHHTEDYKLSAVRYALKTDNQVETCEVFDCKRQSLQRWIKEYQDTGTITKREHHRKSRKVKKEYISFIRSELQKKPQLFLNDLLQMLKEKFPDLDITSQHLGRIIRNQNITRKRLRIVHQPTTYRGKERDHKKEVETYIAEMRKQDMDKIIALDETGIYAALHPSYARCYTGRRCYVKTTDQRVFKKYSLLVAITTKGVIGWKLYEKGAVNAERLTDFIKSKIAGKYENHVIVMDNAIFHKSDIVRDAVKESKNTIQYSVAYYPRSNPIEQFFNQLKHYIKKESPISYEDITTSIRKAITKIKETHLKNYFIHAFRAEWLKKDRKTRKRPKKEYLD
jgi:transposase/transposase-like protein